MLKRNSLSVFQLFLILLSTAILFSAWAYGEDTNSNMAGISSVEDNGILFQVEMVPINRTSDATAGMWFTATNIGNQKIIINKIEVFREPDNKIIARLEVPKKFQELPGCGEIHEKYKTTGKTITLYSNEIKRIDQEGREKIKTGGLQASPEQLREKRKKLAADIESTKRENHKCFLQIKRNSFTTKDKSISPEDEQFPVAGLRINLRDFKDNLKKGDEIIVGTRAFFTRGNNQLTKEIKISAKWYPFD